MASHQYKIIAFLTIGIISSSLVNAESTTIPSSQEGIYIEPVIKEATIEWPEPHPDEKLYLDYDEDYMQALQSDLPSKLVIDTEKRRGGHYLNTTLVGHTGQTLNIQLKIDTGASGDVLLGESKMSDLGIDYYQTTSGKISTVNGITDALYARIDSLKIGQETIHDIEVTFVKDHLLSNNLLGMNILKNYKITLDDKKGTLTLEKIK